MNHDQALEYECRRSGILLLRLSERWERHIPASICCELTFNMMRYKLRDSGYRDVVSDSVSERRGVYAIHCVVCEGCTWEKCVPRASSESRNAADGGCSDTSWTLRGDGFKVLPSPPASLLGTVWCVGSFPFALPNHLR